MRKHSSIRKPLIRTITRTAAAVFMAAMYAADSDSLIPAAALVISGAWLLLYAYANGHMCRVVSGYDC